MWLATETYITASGSGFRVEGLGFRVRV